MTNAPRPAGRPDAVWQMRWLLWGSWLAMIAAAVLVAVEFGRDWSWPVFTAGLAVAVTVAVTWTMPFAVYLYRRGERLPPDRRVMAQHRIVLYASTLLLIGIAVAITAAMLDAAWVLVAYVCLWVLTGVLALLLFAVLLKRLRRRYAEGRQQA